MYRSLTGTPRDVVLLVGRLLLAFIVVAHAVRKMNDGLFETAEHFTEWGIPLAIAAASFTIVVELVFTLSLVLGLRMMIPLGLMTFVMLGAIWFVHGENGLFMAKNGWALVGTIIAGNLMLAAAGPGRFSLDAVLDRKAERRLDQTRAIPRQTITV